MRAEGSAASLRPDPGPITKGREVSTPQHAHGATRARSRPRERCAGTSRRARSIQRPAGDSQRSSSGSQVATYVARSTSRQYDTSPRDGASETLAADHEGLLFGRLTAGCSCSTFMRTRDVHMNGAPAGEFRPTPQPRRGKETIARGVVPQEQSLTGQRLPESGSQRDAVEDVYCIAAV